MLFALGLHAGHDSAGIHSNVAAARALRGVDTEVADLTQGASGHTTPRHAPQNVPGNAGNVPATDLKIVDLALRAVLALYIHAHYPGIDI